MKQVILFPMIAITIFYSLSIRAETCTFQLGIKNGFDLRPCEEHCSAEAEGIFITGYGIGRKKRWTSDDLKQAEYKLQCLKKELEIKFSGTLSPITIDPGTETNGVSMRMKEAGCPSDTVRTRGGLATEIEQTEGTIRTLKGKLKRLNQLETTIASNPDQSVILLQEYREHGVDDRDIDFRWRPHIQAHGGLDKLNMADRESVFTAAKAGHPSSHESLGALIGFGVGHYRQNRFRSDGWIFAVLDTVFAAALISFIPEKKMLDGWAVPIGFLGSLGSRTYQYIDIYTYRRIQNTEWQNLRVDRPAFRFPVVAYEW